jgi:hypothetical protein
VLDQGERMVGGAKIDGGVAVAKVGGGRSDDGVSKQGLAYRTGGSLKT